MVGAPAGGCSHTGAVGSGAPPTRRAPRNRSRATTGITTRGSLATAPGRNARTSAVTGVTPAADDEQASREMSTSLPHIAHCRSAPLLAGGSPAGHPTAGAGRVSHRREGWRSFQGLGDRERVLRTSRTSAPRMAPSTARKDHSNQGTGPLRVVTSPEGSSYTHLPPGGHSAASLCSAVPSGRFGYARMQVVSEYSPSTHVHPNASRRIETAIPITMRPIDENIRSPKSGTARAA
jgi:hypothetical protein